MNTITIDDETFAINSMLRLLKKLDPHGTHTGVRDSGTFLDHIKNDPVDIAFVDVDLYGSNGLDLVKQLACINKEINVIMYTGHTQFKADALDLYVSGYIVKPVTEEDLAEVLKHLRYPIKELHVRCFGHFEVFYGSLPVRFERKDSKEVFAYLIDKNGAEMSEGELRYLLWADDEDTPKKKSYIRTIISDIRNTLSKCGENEIIFNSRGYYFVNPDRLKCDYFDYLNGKDVRAAKLCKYMEQYGFWADITRKALYENS